MKKLFIFIFILIFSPAALIAGQWEVDFAHSQIRFGVKHIYSIVSGHFEEFDGNIFFDPNDLKNSRFDFVVKVKSIKTYNSKRDSHLRSKDFFEADKFGEMKFKTIKIYPKKDNIYTIDGEMTIKDVTQKLSLDFTFSGPSNNPFNKKEQVAGFETSFTLNRLDYHVGTGKFLQMGVVGKNVDVHISIETIMKK